jgi:hypothetical protein
MVRMPKKKTAKLTLNRETLRLLTDAEAGRVHGGAGRIVVSVDCSDPGGKGVVNLSCGSLHPCAAAF